MNSIGKHLNLIGVLLLTAFVGAAAGLYFDVPARLQKPSGQARAAQQYTCPMHPDIVFAEPGDCPKCGMALVPAARVSDEHAGCAHAAPMGGCCGAAGALDSHAPPSQACTRDHQPAPAEESPQTSR